MARLRTANPAAPTDEDVATMSIWARYVWAYLPCHADLDGRLLDKPFSLKLDILPTDDVDMNAVLDELAARRHIVRYEVDGRRYIQIRSFHKHQRPHKNEKSRGFPPPKVSECATDSGKNTSGKVDVPSETLRDPGSGISGSGEVSPAGVPAISGAPVLEPPPELNDPLRPEKLFTRAMDRGEEVTAYLLARVFGAVRQAEVKGTVEWALPKGANEKAAGVVATCASHPEIWGDVVPMMRLLFARAKAGEGDKAAEMLQDPSFAFGAFCSSFTKLQEAVQGLTPKAHAAAVRATGPPRDVRHGHARAEDSKHLRTGEVKL